MKLVWSPWRMKYIMEHEPIKDCIFCKAQNESDGPQNLIVIRRRLAYVILNRYPYTSGHLMVVPFAHTPTLEILDIETRTELMELITVCEKVLDKIYKPQGFNIGANIGSAAGAGVAGHLHFHVVPRWAGDTNFMSAVGNTRVLPEMLEDTFCRVRDAWPSE